MSSKILIAVLFLTLLTTSCRENVKKQIEGSAIVGSENELAQKNITRSRLDKEYSELLNNVSDDNTDSGYEDAQKQHAAIRIYMDSLQHFLLANDFKSVQTVTALNHIYFEPDGTVDYFIYEFTPALDQTKNEKFKILLTTFLATHKIGITRKQKFRAVTHMI